MISKICFSSFSNYGPSTKALHTGPVNGSLYLRCDIKLVHVKKPNLFAIDPVF